jgi:hypothetical protein
VHVQRYLVIGSLIMTLILSRSSRNYILQVTDRLVSGPIEDPLANKNVLYCARNAIVAIGYTGHAFIGDIPTDQWLVEKLTGITFDRSRKPPTFSLNSSPRDQWRDIGCSLKLLKTSLDGARSEVRAKWKTDWTAKPFTILFVGWQWDRRGRYRPLAGELNKSKDINTFQLKYEPRHWYLGNRFSVDYAPRGCKNISQSDIQSLGERLSNKSPDEAEDLLV